MEETKQYMRNLILRNICALRNGIERKMGYRGCDVLNAADGNDLIAELLKSTKPTAIGKIGSVELQAIWSFIKYEGRIGNWFEYIMVPLYRNAGVFPQSHEIFNRFCLEFLESLKNLDLISVWYNPHEPKIVKNYANNASLTDIHALEPYYHNDPWSRYLENKRVLIINPFEESIRHQYSYREKLWQDERCLPLFHLDTIKVPLSDALEKSGFKDWFEVLQYLRKKMSEKEFDVAIIGAGAYSIPLVDYAKRNGKFAIHLGGATQILFGIKGRRWDSHEIGLRFYNRYWIRPLKEETPKNAAIIEDGCYW